MSICLLPPLARLIIYELPAMWAARRVISVRLTALFERGLQVFAAFDTEGEGSLGYVGVAALVRRQLPTITEAELRVIMSHIHLLDKDGVPLAASSP